MDPEMSVITGPHPAIENLPWLLKSICIHPQFHYAFKSSRESPILTDGSVGPAGAQAKPLEVVWLAARHRTQWGVETGCWRLRKSWFPRSWRLSTCHSFDDSGLFPGLLPTSPEISSKVKHIISCTRFVSSRTLAEPSPLVLTGGRIRIVTFPGGGGEHKGKGTAI